MDHAPALPLHAVAAQLALLERLSEAGLQIASAMARQVSETPGAPFMPGPKLFQGDIALGFSRVARAVRLTVALHIKLVGELQALQRGEALPASAAEAEDDDREAAPDIDPPEHAERPERYERPERPERYDEREARDDIHALLDRPTDEVIELIRRDLGLSPEWVAQAKAEWEADQAACGAGRPAWTTLDAPPRAGPGPWRARPPERGPPPAPS